VGGVLRPFAYRLADGPAVVSNCDQELIINITFTSPCHIRKIMFIGGGPDAQHPRSVKAYTNKDNVDFTNVGDLKPVQVFANLPINNEGLNEQITVLRQFTNVTNLTLYVTENYGAATTTLRYIGMQGEHTHYRREAVDAEYEVICNGQDIAAPDEKATPNNLGV